MHNESEVTWLHIMYLLVLLLANEYGDLDRFSHIHPVSSNR